MIKAEFKLDQKAIEAINKGSVEALEPFLDALKTQIASAQVTPKDTGDLEESCNTFVSENTGYITWNTPYARRLFFHPEYNFRTDKNVNAQGRWTDPFVYGEYAPWMVKAFLEFWKRNAGGYLK